MKQRIFLSTLLLFFMVSVSAQLKISLYFDFDEFALTPTAIESMDKTMRQVSDEKMEIENISVSGYCDAVGSDAYNDRLSLQRAETVKQYLLQKGITAPLSTQSFGKQNPLYSNETEENRAKNRRVDILFTIRVPAPVEVEEKKEEKKEKSLSESIKEVKEGDNILLRNINFVPGSAVFLKSAEPALEELLQIMLENPTLEIMIEGHICCDSSPHGGYDLSVQRAKAVYNFLLRQGIGKKRMAYQGFGRTRPLTEERTEEEKSMNRRVEIKVTKL